MAKIAKRIVAVVGCALLCLALWPAAPAKAAGEGATEIWDRAGLEAMAGDPGGSYVLMADIDMGGAPWVPIAFAGQLEGGGHSLYNLVIEQADPQTEVSVDGNRKPYDTVFAALFSRCYNATIQNLHLLGVRVDVDTEQNCYAAALVGYAENTTITGCSVSGSVALAMAGRMCGVGGIAGFGYGSITGCVADVTLTLVDENQAEKCEQFLGGALASGYMDIDGCEITVRGYASVYGYVHNGGVVGMYYVHTEDTGHEGYVRNNTVDAVIAFFEANNNRRAYCSPVIGEQMHWILALEGNTVARFENRETRDTSTTLLPEACAAPAYSQAVSPPGCDAFGYTTHTCGGCGYSYRAEYVAPQHQPGPWETVREAAPGQDGLRARHCALCGALLEEGALVAASGLVLGAEELRLKVGESALLAARVEPSNATETGLVFTSSDEGVARVDGEGRVTAVAPGSATITCAVKAGGVTAVCRVQVAGAFPLALAATIAGAAVLLVLALALVIRARRNKRRAARRAYRRR